MLSGDSNTFFNRKLRRQMHYLRVHRNSQVCIRRYLGHDPVLLLIVFNFCVDLKLEFLNTHTSSYVGDTVVARAVFSAIRR